GQAACRPALGIREKETRRLDRRRLRDQEQVKRDGYGSSRRYRNYSDGSSGSTQDVFNTYISRSISLSFPFLISALGPVEGPQLGRPEGAQCILLTGYKFTFFSTIGDRFHL